MISGEDLRSPGQPTAGAVEAVDGLPVTSTETEGGPVDCAGGQAPSPLVVLRERLVLRRFNVHSYARDLSVSRRRGDQDRSLAQYGMSAGLTAAIEMVDEMIREGR